jgi:MinD-like ATPase involved in chromosome partitioning or flagellar assembly
MVTCYSYKGGVGRSFALANIAVLLAQWNLRVLCIDWDLEAPGLDYYFKANDFDRPGLLELIETVAGGKSPDPADFTFSVSPGSPSTDGTPTIDLLSAGRPHSSYARRVQELNWESLYAERNLGAYLEDWRDTWMRSYDVVLVDSRTGVTDIGGVCTAQLPDVLLLFFTANHQGIEGVLKVRDQALAARNSLPFDRPRLLTVPIPSRIDQGVEYERSEQWRRVFRSSFASCYVDWVAQGVDIDTVMSRTTIPYSAYWSFGEELPALTENHRDPTYVSYPLATVAALLVHRLDKTDVLAQSLDSFVDTAMRLGYRRAGFDYDVLISSSPETQKSAGELTRLLSQAGLRVADSTTVQAGQRWDDHITRLLDGSQHVVLLLGDKPSTWQQREATYVLRQSIDDATERRVLPIVTSDQSRRNMPQALRSLVSYDLQAGSLEDAARWISRISLESRPGH